MSMRAGRTRTRAVVVLVPLTLLTACAIGDGGVGVPPGVTGTEPPPAASTAAPTTTAAPTSPSTSTPAGEPTTTAPPAAPPTTAPGNPAGAGDPLAGFDTFRHPLDGLTSLELDRFRRAVEADPRLAGAVFPSVALAPPDKFLVVDWEPGDPLPARHVAAVARVGAEVYELDVDATAGAIRDITSVPDAVPGFTRDQFARSIAAATADPRMVAGIRARGLEPNDAVCLVFGPGAPRSAAEKGRSRGRVACYRKGDADFWSRPVDGLFATVDLVTGEVLEVVDTGVDPVPAAPADTTPSVPSLSPVAMVPAGAGNLRVDGNAVRWAGWQFRYRADMRAGLVVADARLDLGDGPRRVLYEAYLSDLYVPYHDPDPAWAFRTFLDSAEFGMGTTMTPLTPGVDCPSHGVLAPLGMPTDQARIETIVNAVCLFERPTGTPEWRHAGGLGSIPPGEPGVELVVRTVSTVGNYDYIIDYVFTREGRVRVDAYASGIVLQGATAGGDGAAPARVGVDEHGALMGPDLVGTHHDHFLSFRLDLDVGSSANRFVRARLREEPVTGVPGRTSIWRVDREVVADERRAAAIDDPAAPELWVVEGGDGTSTAPGYLIDPLDATALPLVDSDDPSLQRAGWAENTVWVTPYDPEQRFASGTFVEGGGADGLPEWVAADRSLRDTDLVVWFTMGFHHVPRTEDLPVMPSHRASFELVPWNLSASNPLVGPP
jgi:primary-amine oxidase